MLKGDLMTRGRKNSQNNHRIAEIIPRISTEGMLTSHREDVGGVGAVPVLARSYIRDKVCSVVLVGEHEMRPQTRVMSR